MTDKSVALTVKMEHCYQCSRDLKLKKVKAG